MEHVLRQEKTLVLGMGNPILCDDGAGIKAAEGLQEKLADCPWVTVVTASLAGLNLLDIMTGYDRVIIIDAIQTGRGRPGSVYRLGPDDVGQARHAATIHGVGLVEALALGRQVGWRMPGEIVVYAIEAANVSTFSEQCTAPVAAAIPEVQRRVLQEIGCI